MDGRKEEEIVAIVKRVTKKERKETRKEDEDERAQTLMGTARPRSSEDEDEDEDEDEGEGLSSLTSMSRSHLMRTAGARE